MPLIRRPLRVQRIHTERGVSQSQATVECPLAHFAIPASECSACPRNHEMKASGTSPAEVVCSLPDEAMGGRAPPLRAEVAALLGVTPVDRVMTQDVICVTAEVSLERLSKIFADRQMSCAPVLDGSGVLIGVVTKTDVVCEFFDFEHEPPTDVADVMTRRPATVRDTSTLAQVLPLLKTTHHLPVVSARGNVVGIISAQDIIQWLADSTGVPSEP